MSSFLVKCFGVLTLLCLSLTAQAQYLNDDSLSLQRMKDDLGRLQRDMTQIQKEIYRENESGSSKKSWSSWGSGGDNNASTPQIQAMMAEVEERISDLNGRIEETEYKLGRLTEKLETFMTDVDYRFNELGSTQNAASESSFNAPLSLSPAAGTTEIISESLPASNDPSSQYENAFSLLRKADYSAAELAFKQFIDSHPDNSLVGNAYYWLAETFYVRSDYKQAAVYFLKGYRDHPNGNKTVDSLLKLGMSLAGLDKKQEACTTFNKLEKEFPNANTDVTKTLEKEKRVLRC